MLSAGSVALVARLGDPTLQNARTNLLQDPCEVTGANGCPRVLSGVVECCLKVTAVILVTDIVTLVLSDAPTPWQDRQTGRGPCQGWLLPTSPGPPQGGATRGSGLQDARLWMISCFVPTWGVRPRSQSYTEVIKCHRCLLNHGSDVTGLSVIFLSQEAADA